jgi:hypothetical protein
MDNRFRNLTPQSPSEQVVDAVAACADTDPLDLPPLYESIDTDALDALFRSNGGDCTVVFEYADYEVTVDCGREPDIRVDERDGPSTGGDNRAAPGRVAGKKADEPIAELSGRRLTPSSRASRRPCDGSP